MTLEDSAPPTFAVLTNFDDQYEVGYLCATVNDAYCRRWGHRFLPCVLSQKDMQRICEGRHFAWAKLALFAWLMDPERVDQEKAEIFEGWLGGEAARQELLRSVEYLVWIDGDAMVLKHDVPMASFVSGTMRNADIILGEDMSCADWLNTGVFFVRAASVWASTLWADAWVEAHPRFHQAPFWDQSAMCQTFARRGEFVPDVLGAAATGKQPSQNPWYTWQGGRLQKQTRHLHVLDASVLQFANPMHAHFIFHACGFTKKLDLCRKVVQLGAIRGLATLALRTRDMQEKAASPFWQEAQDLIQGAVDSKLPYPWGWPAVEDVTLPRSETGDVPRMSMTEVERQWQSIGCEEPAVVYAAAPGSWSVAHLRNTHGEVQVLVDDCAPLRATDCPRLGDVVGPTARVQLWQFCDYAIGRPPPTHRVLGHLDPSRVWRIARWRPWEATSGKVHAKSADLAPPWEKFAAESGEGDGPFAALWSGPDASLGDVNDELCSLASVHVTPPGAVTRLHRAHNGDSEHLLIWQLDGKIDVVLYSPRATDSLCEAAELGPLFDDTQSSFDPWSASECLPADHQHLRTELNPGDVLLVPCGWWITTRGRSPSVSVWRRWTSQARASKVRESRRHRTQEWRRFEAPDPERVWLCSQLAARVKLPSMPNWCKETLRSPASSQLIGKDFHSSQAIFVAVVHMDDFLPDGRGVRSSRLLRPPAPILVLVRHAMALGSDALAAALRDMKVGEVARVAIRDSRGSIKITVIELLAIRGAIDGEATSGCPQAGGWSWFGDPENWLGAPPGHEPVDQVALAAEAEKRQRLDAKRSERIRLEGMSGKSLCNGFVAACVCRRAKWATRRRRPDL